MSILIHRRAEGDTCRNGLNWTWDKSSQPTLVFRLGKLIIYFRRRSDYIFNSNPNAKWYYRYIFSCDWVGYFLVGALQYKFETNTLQVRNKSVTYEQLVDFIEKEGTLVNTSTPTR